MDMYELKWTRLQAEIFRLLCIKAGLKLNLREIARFLRVSPTAVSKALIELDKDEIVKIKKNKVINLLSIELNRNNSKVIEIKRVENLKMIYESELSNFLLDKFTGCTVILFGSYSSGGDIITESGENDSDIDIAIIGTKGKDLELKEFSNLLERKININFYDSWKGIHKNLKDSILNGILLEGSIDL